MELPPTLNIPEENLTLRPPSNPTDSTLAITSLITGIMGWTVVPLLGSVVAIITGHLAKKEINESQGAISGHSMATAGLILGYVQLGFVVLASIVAIILILVASVSYTM